MAATTAPVRTTERCSTIAPLATIARSSIVQPSRCTMWPITHSSPTTVGASIVVCSTVQSWMLVRAPMRISPSSARSTAFGQTVLSGPMRTAPMTTASGWT